jgi:putative restriction endonuclease
MLYIAAVASELDDLAFRESVFAWLRLRLLTQEAFSRADLSAFSFQGTAHRLVGTQTGIWKVKGVSQAAVSILTAYVPEGAERPYEDSVGPDGLLRYKYRGTDPGLADNTWLRLAMERHLPLVWFIGIGYVPGTKTQVFRPQFPVWLVAEEPEQHQFVVAVDELQESLPVNADPHVIEITRRYNTRLVKSRVHQPVFRSAVLHSYERRCAVCRLPFVELLDAAHIRPDSDGGAARVSNGLALCKIHHGAFDSNLIGISPDYVVHVKESVLATFDGPTLQHSIKEMHGERLRQIPTAKSERPSRDLLAERFEAFNNVA